MSRKHDYYGVELNQSFSGFNIRKLLRRKGLWYICKKSFYQFLFPYIYPVVKRGTFVYNGKVLRYFNHKYNLAHSNERTVEIAIALDTLQYYRAESVLEVGNVLSHYRTGPNWDIVDKYEEGIGVINCDILDFHPPKKYELILSISTIEHIGFDEQPQDSEKPNAALRHMYSLLAEGGIMLVTFPLGWNPCLDLSFKRCGLPLNTKVLTRQTWYNTWEEQSKFVKDPFKLETYIGADYVVIANATKPFNSRYHVKC